YQQAIATSVAKLGRAVFFGALTTAVGFLALILSGSMGFSHLGVLIAIGIFFAGLFMCTILFLFVRPRQAPQRPDWVFEIVKKSRRIGRHFRKPAKSKVSRHRRRCVFLQYGWKKIANTFAELIFRRRVRLSRKH